MNCEFAENAHRFDDTYAIPISTNFKNQSLSRIVIKQIKRIAERWSTSRHREEEPTDPQVHQIASAYYLFQLP